MTLEPRHPDVLMAQGSNRPQISYECAIPACAQRECYSRLQIVVARDVARRNSRLAKRLQTEFSEVVCTDPGDERYLMSEFGNPAGENRRGATQSQLKIGGQDLCSHFWGFRKSCGYNIDVQFADHDDALCNAPLCHRNRRLLSDTVNFF
jgi:hypothetical protein